MKIYYLFLVLILFSCQNKNKGTIEIQLVSSKELEDFGFENEVLVCNNSDSIWNVKTVDDSTLRIVSIGYCLNGEEVKSIPEMISNGRFS